MKIVIDFALLSRPYGLGRCTFQLMHFANIASILGHKVVCVTSDIHRKRNKVVRSIRRMLTTDRSDLNCDMYIAKADAFYRDDNWEQVRKINGFKVCLCNSDRTFRESSVPFRKHRGNPVQERCDLYMPCNHTSELIDKYKHKVVPVSHPIDPRMYQDFINKRIYRAYLMNDFNTIRDAYKVDETKQAGFMGNRNPENRYALSLIAPQWCEFVWARSKSSADYIKMMCGYRACLDMRGNGDKSLRFTEAALFGRTLICEKLPSIYEPILQNNVNCILLDKWSDICNVEFDRDRWLKLSEQATHDYDVGWSLLGQFRTMVDRANGAK